MSARASGVPGAFGPSRLGALDFDTFDRPDFTSNAGTTDLRLRNWSYAAGDLSISSNKLIRSAGTAWNVATVDPKQSNVIVSADMTVTTSWDSGLWVRGNSADNGIWFDVTRSTTNTAQARLFSRTGTSFTGLSALSGTFTMNDNATHAIRLEAIGTLLNGYVNGTLICTYNTSTAYDASTKVGIGFNAANTGVAWDNFKVY